MLRLAARLPDPLVRLSPDLRRALGLRLHDRPEAARQPLAVARVEQDRVEDGAEDVVLPLVERAVSDSHGPGARVAGQVVARRLVQIAPAVDAVHDLQRAVLGRLEVGDELHELVGLPVEVQPVERLEGERRVADPGVAVVPVPLAARRLGERGRERGHGRARRHVGEALDRQRRALDRVAQAVIGDPRAAQPPAPEARRRVDAAPPPRRASAERRAPRPTTGRSRRARRPRARGGRGPARPRCRARDRRRSRNVTPGAGRVGGVTVAVDRASRSPASRP